MDYLETAKRTIREEWFRNHMIKSVRGEPGFQKITWGEAGTSTYQVKYVLTDNMVYISGDVGTAAYSLSEMADINSLGKYDLSFFTKKLVAAQRRKCDFDDRKAREEIKKLFFDWCNAENSAELSVNDRNLYNNLIDETFKWSTPEQFYMGIYNVLENTHSEWFNSEKASSISDCGKVLSYSVISYWVGLKMIAEQLKNQG